MLSRYFICQNDVTTAGGVVTEGHIDELCMGRPLSYEGAQIMCRACKSIGHIKCIPPRRPHTLRNGREVALENDLCICKCPKPPKLVASQTSVSMDFEKHEFAATEAGEDPVTPPSSTVAVEAPTICLECLAAAAAAGASMVVRS